MEQKHWGGESSMRPLATAYPFPAEVTHPCPGLPGTLPASITNPWETLRGASWPEKAGGRLD